MRPTQAPQAATSVSRRPGRRTASIARSIASADDARIGNEAHLDLALLVLHAEVKFLGIDHALRTVDFLQAFDDARGNHLAGSEQRDVVHVFAGRRLDDILQALGTNGIFLVGQLQQFDLVYRRSGTVRKLLGNIPAFQPRHHVKAVWPNDSRHLLNGDICIPAEVRNVAGVVLVGKDKADRVSMLLQCLVGAANARLEFFPRRHVVAVNGRSVLQHS